MPVNYTALSYRIGKPGMIMSHSYKHTRQMIQDTAWTNQQAYNFYFGTACLVKAGKLDTPQGTAGFGGEFIGVFQDNEKYVDRDFYLPKDLVTVATMADIWVRVPTGITIVPLQDKVSYLETLTNGIGGYFTNAAPAAGIIAVANARFITQNMGGYAGIAIESWKGN